MKMKSKILSVFILAVMTLNGMAQFAEQKTVIRKDHKGIVQSIEYWKNDKSVSIPKSADVFFKDVLNTQTSDRFEKIPRKSNRKGYVHEHFQQFYNGVKVEGAGYNFHYRNGEMFFAHGKYIKIDGLNERPAITDEDAKTFFADYKKIPLDVIREYFSELLIREIPLGNDTLPTLVYKIRLISGHKDNTEIGIVDAQTGKVLITEPALIDAYQGRFETRYSGVQYASTEKLGNYYILLDNSRGATIHTYNLNDKYDLIFRTELYDSDNNWTAAEHKPSNNDMGLDVHWGLQQIYDRLYNVHGRNSYDDNGHPIETYIRYGYNTDNGYWDPSLQCILLGAGQYVITPAVSLDFVAHEFGHGISDHQLGYWHNYYDFSEGMSDIWAVIMKYRITPNQPTWKIFDQVMIGYSCDRNIPNPTDARTEIACTYGTTVYNYGCCHIRGGVFSRWFYFLVNGGSGTNGIGNFYSVQGVGMDIAEDLIVDAVYSGFLSNISTYAQLRTNIVNAARILDGGQDGPIVRQVEKAWYAVGVGTSPPSIFGSDVVCCGGSEFTLFSHPPGTVTWEVNSPFSFSSSSSLLTYTGSQPYVYWTGASASIGTLIAKVNGVEVDRIPIVPCAALFTFSDETINVNETRTVGACSINVQNVEVYGTLIIRATSTVTIQSNVKIYSNGKLIIETLNSGRVVIDDKFDLSTGGFEIK